MTKKTMTKNKTTAKKTSTAKDKKYNSYSYRVLMPETEIIKTINVNTLKPNTKEVDKSTFVTEIQMPIEYGFFRGVEYAEKNTLFEYPGQKWEKLTVIKFKEGGKALFGTNEIKKVDVLTKIDNSIKDVLMAVVTKNKPTHS